MKFTSRLSMVSAFCDECVRYSHETPFHKHILLLSEKQIT